MPETDALEAHAQAHQDALQLAQAAADVKAVELVMLEVNQLTVLADYFIICHGTSDRHVRAIADRVLERGRDAGLRPLAVEGQQEACWILLDYGDVLVHIFEESARERYHLEELWADAPRVVVDAAA